MGLLLKRIDSNPIHNSASCLSCALFWSWLQSFLGLLGLLNNQDWLLVFFSYFSAQLLNLTSLVKDFWSSSSKTKVMLYFDSSLSNVLKQIFFFFNSIYVFFSLFWSPLKENRANRQPTDVVLCSSSCRRRLETENMVHALRNGGDVPQGMIFTSGTNAPYTSAASIWAVFLRGGISPGLALQRCLGIPPGQEKVLFQPPKDVWWPNLLPPSKSAVEEGQQAAQH